MRNYCVQYLLAIAVAIMLPMRSRAGETYDAVTQAQLEDNQIEYEELGALIREYNPTMAIANIEYYDSVTTYKSMLKELKSSRSLLEQEADDLEDNGDKETAQIYDTNAAALKASEKQLQDQIDNLTEENSTKNLEKTANTLTSSAQALMITYDQMGVSKEKAQKEVELKETLYQDALAKKQVGTAAEADVLLAKKDWESAVNSLASIENRLSQTKTSLCLLTGKDENQIQIMRVPAVETELIRSIDLEADCQKAIGNNYSLQTSRHAISKKAGETHKSSVRTAYQEENSFRVTMEDLYDDVLIKKTEYEAALTVLEESELSCQALEIKNRSGMLSRSDYLQGQVSYLEKKSEEETAKTALRQSYEAYQWAILGIVNGS